MISTKDLRVIARARLRDAQVLLKAKRFDGAFYLSGYAVELALKARICRTLKWREFPQSGREFEDFRSLRTHNLEVLLKFSGVEERVTAKRAAEWSVVADWDPEKRYQAIGALKPLEAEQMVKCVERLLEVL
jgi:HEPN domain-containing protein